MILNKLFCALAFCAFSLQSVSSNSAIRKHHVNNKKMSVAQVNVSDSISKGYIAETPEISVTGGSIVNTALKYLGARYRSGHRGPNAFDCSGFTSYVYGQQNIMINRSSRSQYLQGIEIMEKEDLKKGDLVFFGGSGSSRSVGHVGIVTEVDPQSGNFKFVHAARTGVKIDNSNTPYYTRRYLGARRILQE